MERQPEIILQCHEESKIVWFPDLIDNSLRSSVLSVDKSNEIDNRYSPLNDNLFLENFIIRDSKGFLTHLERELRPIPKFYALVTPINISSDGTVTTKDANTIIDIDASNSFVQGEVKKPVRQRQRKASAKAGKNKSLTEEKTENHEPTRRLTKKQTASNGETKTRKRLKTNFIAEDEMSTMILGYENKSNKNHESVDIIETGTRRRTKAVSTKKRTTSTNKRVTQKVVCDLNSSLFTSNLSSLSSSGESLCEDLNSLDPESLTGISSKKSSTSLPPTPVKAGSLSMILNFDNISLEPAPAASMPISLP
ncbi:2434_t:CDS:1 [Cetraspora pellucida]|uniref:2434_t:CDS:1 n=1 Tax=Cetraspora pellucida TaxID=1433469 RepID=A0A9N9N7Q3_9GLOM|nr:2434_t:CDS:1 [Cetraspora pellucida]